MIRKTRAYNYGRKTAPPPQPAQTARMKKASHLPNPGPGVVVTVPITLAPEWLELHGLEPDGPKISANQPLVVRVRRAAKDERKVDHE